MLQEFRDISRWKFTRFGFFNLLFRSILMLCPYEVALDLSVHYIFYLQCVHFDNSFHFVWSVFNGCTSFETSCYDRRRKKTPIVSLACIWIASCIVYPAKTFILTMGSNYESLMINIIGTSLVTLMGITYGLTYYNLKKLSENCALANVSDRQRVARVKKEKQFLGTIVIIAGITVDCGLSSAIFHHYAFFTENRRVATNPYGLFSSIYFFNFANKPVVYVLRFPNYRKTFCLLYCCKRTSR